MVYFPTCARGKGKARVKRLAYSGFSKCGRFCVFLLQIHLLNRCVCARKGEKGFEYQIVCAYIARAMWREQVRSYKWEVSRKLPSTRVLRIYSQTYTHTHTAHPPCCITNTNTNTTSTRTTAINGAQETEILSRCVARIYSSHHKWFKSKCLAQI